MDVHPEQPRDLGLEPTIGDQLRLADALRLIERAEPEELRQVARLLAQQAFVTHPAAIRYLTREAGRHLRAAMGVRPMGSPPDGQPLAELLVAGAAGEEGGAAPCP